MTEERILEMLTNYSYLKVINTTKSCQLPTTGSKMDIIMRLKNAMANNDNNFKKLFSKLLGHSVGGLSFSCQHGIVYYLKFILRVESPRDYVDGLLSLAYIPNIVVVDMAHIVAKHATSSRKDDAKYYVHLCLFDKFHERYTTSKIEVLRRIWEYYRIE